MTMGINVLLDFAQSAEPNTTKAAFFYNIDSNNRSIPLNQKNLDDLSSYLTIGSQSEGSYVKYYRGPYFSKHFFEKYFNRTWLGTLGMNETALAQWEDYATQSNKTPTYIWKRVVNDCFQNKTDGIELYDYSAILPSIIPITHLYVFTWKTILSKETNCTQSTYSLTDDELECSVFRDISCPPPFT